MSAFVARKNLIILVGLASGAAAFFAGSALSQVVSTIELEGTRPAWLPELPPSLGDEFDSVRIDALREYLGQVGPGDDDIDYRLGELRRIEPDNPLATLKRSAAYCNNPSVVSERKLSGPDGTVRVPGLGTVPYRTTSVTQRIEYPGFSDFDQQKLADFLNERHDDRIASARTFDEIRRYTDGRAFYEMLDKDHYFSTRTCAEMHRTVVALKYTVDFNTSLALLGIAPAMEEAVRAREKKPYRCPTGVSVLKEPANVRVALGNATLKGRDWVKLKSAAKILESIPAGYSVDLTLTRYLCALDFKHECDGPFGSCPYKKKVWFAKRRVETRKSHQLVVSGTAQGGDLSVSMTGSNQPVLSWPILAMIKRVEPSYSVSEIDQNASHSALTLSAEFGMERKVSLGVALTIEALLAGMSEVSDDSAPEVSK